MISWKAIAAYPKRVLAGLRKDGSFVSNYAILLSGAGANIGVQMVIAPLLSRIYGPEAYGVFSLFAAFSANLALLAGLRLPQALQLPDNSGAIKLTQLTLLSALVFCIVLSAGFFWWASPVLTFFNAEAIIPYSWLIPVMVFLLVVNQVMGQWQYRLNAFRQSAVLDTGVLIFVRVFNLGLGWASQGTTLGLVLGDFVGKISGILLSWKLVVREKVLEFLNPKPFSELRRTLLEYRSYPVFNLPGMWVSLLSDQLIVFFISFMYGLELIGLYSMATSLLDLPKRLLAYSATSVFYKRAVELNKESLRALQSLVIRFVYFFLLAALVPYSLIMVFGPELFSFIFGARWHQAGQLAQYLAIYCIFELIYIALDSVYYVLRKEKSLFVFQITGFLLRLAVFSYCYFSGQPVQHTILLFTISNVIFFSCQLIVLFRLIQIRWMFHLTILYLSVLSVVLMLFVVRSFFLTGNDGN